MTPSGRGQLESGALAHQLAALPVPGLVGEPYPYQQVGMAWLRFMVRHGVGCILADEMGLGKTLQVIGVFAGEVAAQRRPKYTIAGYIGSDLLADAASSGVAPGRTYLVYVTHPDVDAASAGTTAYVIAQVGDVWRIWLAH